MARISTIKFGDVPQVIIDKILRVMLECYELVGIPLGDSVDLQIYEKAEAEMFFTTHDSLEGKPRISVYLDNIKELARAMKQNVWEISSEPLNK